MSASAAPPLPASHPLTEQSAALAVRGLRKRYEDVVAVDGLDLEVATGECFGLLGPNGAGKTTTIEICEGLTTPDEGDVVVLGRRWRTDELVLRELLGIQLQETELSAKLTVEETIRLFRSFYRRGRTVDEVIRLVQLGEKRHGRVGKLSGGQKQRLALACAIVGDPALLFLDEPTTGLDPQSRRQLWDLIEEFKAMGRSIVLTTHYMEEAERLCDRVAIVDHGRVIAQGTPRELIASLGAEHVVEFGIAGRTRREPGAAPGGWGVGIADHVLAQLPGVDAVRRLPSTNEERAEWELRVAAPHRTIPALLAELAERHLELAELRTHSATLEDVFVALTGRQLRDE
ncbi:MAG TPA: ABC transporter ATP-binding protein [Gemmatimonadaceae bacterium]|nr:ABC transporter ATP-binding protein [Gemmatimonadaceae bacterium]